MLYSQHKINGKEHKHAMYNFIMHLNIMHAINNRNNIVPGDKLTLLDGALICLIKSFQDNSQQFYISNKELAKIFIANESTIQRSINKLTNLGLLSSEKIYSGQQPRRYLSYNKEKLQELIQMK